MNEKDEDEFYSTSIEYMRHLDLESKEFYPLLITIGLTCHGQQYHSENHH